MMHPAAEIICNSLISKSWLGAFSFAGACSNMNQGANSGIASIRIPLQLCERIMLKCLFVCLLFYQFCATKVTAFTCLQTLNPESRVPVYCFDIRWSYSQTGLGPSSLCHDSPSPSWWLYQTISMRLIMQITSDRGLPICFSRCYPLEVGGRLHHVLVVQKHRILVYKFNTS